MLIKPLPDTFQRFSFLVLIIIFLAITITLHMQRVKTEANVIQSGSDPLGSMPPSLGTYHAFFHAR